MGSEIGAGNFTTLVYWQKCAEYDEDFVEK
jgi:hypothetical protein